MPANETIMLMTLSHCVVVRTFLVGSVTATVGGSADGVSGFSCLFAMMLCALIRAFFCASRASFVLRAISLPTATCFGFFCFVTGVCEVTCYVAGVCEDTCCSTGCCESAIYFAEKIIFN